MVKLIEKTKVQDIVSERKRKQQEGSTSGEKNSRSFNETIQKKFRQQKSLGKDYDDSGNKVDKQILNKIFSKK